MKTMKIFIFIGLALLLASCKQGQKPEPFPEELTKLERLYRIRPDSVMKYYDLSNDSLTEFPDLSRYVIASLDLSHNLLDTVILERLPLGIERLDVSYNRLKGDLIITSKSMPTLRELDASHNCLELVYTNGSNLYRLNVSHNKMRKLHCARMQYINASYNNFEERGNYIIVDFYPVVVDTLIHEGIKEGKKIVDRRWYHTNFCWSEDEG